VAATEGEKPMLTGKQARELLRLCKSARIIWTFRLPDASYCQVQIGFDETRKAAR
jgi:hypothetical protein